MTADPLRYFRIEARELVLGLSQGALELGRGSADAGVVARLFRLAHTLKGAARVVRQLELATLAHEAEEVLARGRDAGRGVTEDEAKRLLGLVTRMESLLEGLAEPPAETAPAARPTVEDAFQTVRIEIEEMDAVLRAVTETGVHVSGLKTDLGRLRQLGGLSAALASRLASRPNATHSLEAREQGLAEDLQVGLERLAQMLETRIERVEQELGDVREGTDRLRLVPVDSLFPPLARAVRDAAEALGKRVDVALDSGGLRLDSHVLGPLRDALSHVVRNAVAHGIETPEERRALGKPPAGKLALKVSRRERTVVLACEDDGRGIDVRAVRRGLVARGLTTVAEADALAESDLLERLFSAGLSTSRSVTQISGRGVGLDVVREVAQKLGGEVGITTSAGRGTRVELRIPASLSAMRALIVEVLDSSLAIPLDAVRATLRIEPKAISGDRIVREGQVIPFVPLARALRREVASVRSTWSAVVVGAGERLAAVGVDRLRGSTDVVLRALPVAAAADAIVAGAWLDAEGNPQLVLDPEGLVAAANQAPGTPAEAAEERLPILVIDDSLTTRMLEQSILESAGYAVELAFSAEQGLEKARQKRYGLFIVDVEMPGMDGFEFVTRTRADPELGRVPAILVTSRNAPEDQLRGQRAGASAYIVKGEFDQNLLLDSVRRLLG